MATLAKNKQKMYNLNNVQGNSALRFFYVREKTEEKKVIEEGNDEEIQYLNNGYDVYREKAKEIRRLKSDKGKRNMALKPTRSSLYTMSSQKLLP
eukprot:CAMPEP_0205806222 /NCGR_PEP_ID=MMETSP0205-20121125/9669_1 /ASSEMBLY_ACC=CAM_ASM_000278 /TAXON_ID=36767 /ORGANISM="Euplotes focardii, Strain TN1" /LENGTH=94 /DNA_ID=CAMNT_0053078671 /DNA_START=83 /DNA_END=363 /DNA_ORIENTATION=-